MPFAVSKNPDGSYRVTSSSGTKAKHTTAKKAYIQKWIMEKAMRAKGEKV